MSVQFPGISRSQLVAAHTVLLEVFEYSRISGAGSDGQNHMITVDPLQRNAPAAHSGLITLESRI